MEFQDQLDIAIFGPVISEGSIFSVNTMASEILGVPEGRYLIQSIEDNKCMLVSTSEASDKPFEVFKRTLEGFHNPEVHKRAINNNTDILVEEPNATT